MGEGEAETGDEDRTKNEKIDNSKKLTGFF